MNRTVTSLTATADPVGRGACNRSPETDLHAFQAAPSTLQVKEVVYSNPYTVKTGDTWVDVFEKFLDTHDRSDNEDMRNACKLLELSRKTKADFHITLGENGLPQQGEESSLQPGKQIVFIVRVNGDKTYDVLREIALQGGCATELFLSAEEVLKKDITTKKVSEWKNILLKHLGPDEDYYIQKGDTMTSISMRGLTGKLSSAWAPLIREYIEAKNRIEKDQTILTGKPLSVPSSKTIRRALLGIDVDEIGPALVNLTSYYQALNAQRKENSLAK